MIMLMAVIAVFVSGHYSCSQLRTGNTHVRRELYRRCRAYRMKARIGSPDERRSQTGDQPGRGMRRWEQDNAEEPSIGIAGPLPLPKIVVSNHESGSVWRDGVSPKDLPQGRPHHGFFM